MQNIEIFDAFECPKCKAISRADNFETLICASCGESYVYFEDEAGLSIINLNSNEAKPILRDLSQMKKKETIEFKKHFKIKGIIKEFFMEDCGKNSSRVWFVKLDRKQKYVIDSTIQQIDWLTRKGFAIRGEFERGVAVREEVI